ncbi:MAG: SEC-C domain-containing protein [Gammaproteobacteria bacterium]|nr:SEC-C domain-containing protein [Gammaproteobacteria bacterium]
MQLASAGYVEFVVSYLQGGKLHQFSEVSRFLPLVTSAISSLESSSAKGISADPLPINSTNRSTAEPCWQWRYIDGVLSNRPSKSIGRNDACPCGSGKKFKQCLVHQSAH